jgi:hypothetical protein
MALRSPIAFHAYWGIFAAYNDLPNVAGSSTQSANVQVGDQAYVSADQMLYFCISATLGAAIWSPMGLSPTNFDAFGRLRISAPQTVFDSKLVYDAQPLYWAEEQTGGAAAGVWNQPDARVRLTVAASQTSVRQSRRYFTYQPGKSQLVFHTFNLNGPQAGVAKRVGYFDATNGFFLELDGVAAVNFVRRSSSSVPTTTVAQGSWNLDPMDGTGPSGVTLDFAETAILVIAFEWLGVGSAWMGFVVDGVIYYAHRFDNANVNPAVYMSTPNLPTRYELDAGAGLVGNATLDCICSSVSSEGGLQGTGTKFGFALPARVTGIGSGASHTMFSIRHNGTYPRVTIVPTSVGPLADSNGTSKWELIYNPTFTVAPTWLAATRGYCDIDSDGAVTLGTGTVIAAGVFSNTTSAVNLDLTNTTLTLGSDVSAVSDVISLVVTNTSGGNANYQAAIDWLALT